MIRRPMGSTARCTVVDGETAVRALEIPVWMLAAAWCRHMRGRTEPVTSVDALKALRTLLAEVAPSRATRCLILRRYPLLVRNQEATMDANRPPYSTEPYARSVCAESADLGPPSGADAPAGGRSARACPDRARARRDARPGEGHG